MSGNLTVIGGHSSSVPLSGLVSIPSGFTGPVLTSLQTLLTSVSGAVSTSSANFENLNVAGLSGAQSPTVGGFSTGVLVVSNYNSTSGSVTGSTTVSLTVPSGYDTLVVEAPGSETVQGSGGSFLGLFGSNSSVNFNAAGGNGTIYGSGNDTVAFTGADYFVGGSGGNESVSATGSTAAVTTGGAGDFVKVYSANSTILSAGSSDVIKNSGVNTNSLITVTGSGGSVQNVGGNVTISAIGTGSTIGFFNGSAGGTIDFINNSSSASSIIAALSSSTGAISSQGSVTVSAGAGGGVYDGGVSGNNSLVGGSGAVTLFSAGVGNYLYANGAATGSNSNLLNAFSGSNDTLIASSNTTSNIFYGGTGTESILSSGSGSQTYFVGTIGSETISGSAAQSATNNFIFNQTSAQGGGTVTLENFKPGEAGINATTTVTGVTITSFEALHGAHAGTEIDFSNGTTVKIFGVSSSAFNASIIGGTRF